MDAIDILGSLLGGRKSGGSGGGGLGGAILGQILKNATGGARQPGPQQSSPPASSNRGSSRVSTPGDLQKEASELEDLLNVAQDRNQQRTQAPTQHPMPRTFPQQAPQQQFPQSNSPFSNSPFTKPTSRPQNAPPPRRDPTNNPQQQNDDAIVLIRAMINAAKSDGDISEAEQQSILERIGDPSQDVIDFLRNEFNQPLDVREFAWSVPLGMEQKVYTMSLAAIELDQNKEAAYLRDLAHGLRLTPDVCNQIHQQFGAQAIF